MDNYRKRAFVFTCVVLFLTRALQAEETYPVKVKLLLSPPTSQTVIASLRSKKDRLLKFIVSTPMRLISRTDNTADLSKALPEK
jgi:hypothetical protein